MYSFKYIVVLLQVTQVMADNIFQAAFNGQYSLVQSRIESDKFLIKIKDDDDRCMFMCIQ